MNNDGRVGQTISPKPVLLQELVQRLGGEVEEITIAKNQLRQLLNTVVNTERPEEKTPTSPQDYRGNGDFEERAFTLIDQLSGTKSELQMLVEKLARITG